MLVGDEAEVAHALVLAGEDGGVEDVLVEGVALEQRLVGAVHVAVDVGNAAGRHGCLPDLDLQLAELNSSALLCFGWW